jgi:uncharacterized protein (DUF1697 family)
MSTWIAFLRGIGGGIRPMVMKDLQAALENLGLSDVRTYIQSGNVVFRRAGTTAAKLEAQIGRRIAERFGFESRVFVLSAAQLARAAAANPFGQADDEPTSVHLFFLSQRPRQPDLGAMKRLKTPSEAFVLAGRVLYVHTPDGFGVSKLAARIEKLLGVPATARNWRTVTKMLALSTEIMNSG